MAFCAVTEHNIERLTLRVFHLIRTNPSSLKDFKAFTQSIVNELIAKNASVDKAITLASYLPQIVSEFNSDKDNRKLLKQAGISLDAISEVEDSFESYSSLAKFLNIKNETQPLVIVNEHQLSIEKKIRDFQASLKVEIVGNKRSINGTTYEIRTTDIAKAGYKTDNEDVDEVENQASPALKHGNTVDAIAKDIFEGVNPDYKDFEGNLDKVAFDGIVARLKSVKSKMEEEGYVFITGVTVFNKTLKISGEIDLVAINPKGEVYIMDFKTANQRFNETYLRNTNLNFKSDDTSFDVSILSKWEQYATQGYIYGLMLSEQLGIPVTNRVGIIGLSISYDRTIPAFDSKINSLTDITIHSIPVKDVRSEFKGKSLQEIYDEYKKLEDKSLGTVTEIKPATPRRERKKFNKINPDTPLDRLAKIEEIAASDEELKKEIDWFKSNPISKDFLLRFDDAINSGLFGHFSLSAITLYNGASAGTVYHEGWHRFSQIFLSKSQKDTLYDSVRKDNIKFRTRDGRTIHTATAELVDVEEFLAEEFAKFGLNPETYSYPTGNPEPKSIFQRIWEFLSRFFGANPRPITLFQKLYRGRVGRYSPSINNAYWSNLNSLAINSKGEEIVSNERFPVYVGAMNHLIGKELKTRGKSFTALKQSKSLQSAVFEKVFNSLTEKYESDSITEEQADELESILDNWYDFVKAYLPASEYDSLKDFKVEEDIFTLSSDELMAMDDIANTYDEPEDIDENEEASRPELFGTQPGNEEAAFSIADDPVQDYFRSVEKIKELKEDGTIEYVTDELGFPVNHTYYDIFYKVKKLLSGKFSMSAMLKAMEDPNNIRLTPELKTIREDLGKFFDNKTEKNHYRNVQNIQFLQSFFKVMVMPEVPNMQIGLDFTTGNYKFFKPTMISYRKASRSLSLKIIQNWAKNFKDIRGRDYIGFRDLLVEKKNHIEHPLYLTEDGKMLLNPFADYQQLFPQTIKGIKEFYLTLGITLNEKVFQDGPSVELLRKHKTKIIRNLSIYAKYKEPIYAEEAEEFLVADKIDTSNITSLKGYVEAMPDEAIDVAARLHFIENPLSFFNEKRIYEISQEIRGKEKISKESTDALRFIFEDIAELEEKFGERISSGSFRIEDKTKYPYYIPNQLLLINNMLNEVKSHNDFVNHFYLQHLDPVKNKWLKRSYFYSLMFDYNGERNRGLNDTPITIVTEDIASVRMKTEDGITEKHPRSLTTNEKFFMDVASILKAGAIEMPRAETSSTMFSVRLSDYGNGKALPITFKEVLGATGDRLPELFQEIVKNYFAAEIEKRQWFMKNDPEAKGANKIPLAKQFNIFQGILSPELRAKVEKFLHMTPEEIFEQEGINGEFRKEVYDYFEKRVAEIRPKFDSLPQEHKKMLADTVEYPQIQSMYSVAKTFVLNRFILGQEYYNLYFGDLYYYKNPPKRGKIVTNTGTSYFIDEYRNEWLNGIQNETLNSIYTGKKPGGKDFRTYKTAVVKDVVMQSAYVHDDDNQNILLKDILNMRVAAGVMVPGTPSYIQELKKLKEILSKYNKIDIADGQGIIGLDFYRNFSIITDIWSETKEKEYERQLAIFRSHFGLYFKLDEEGNKVPLEGTELEEAKERDLKLTSQKPFDYFNPLKISYTGPAAKDGPMRPVFDKFSVRPILPEVAIGRRDESMLLEMVKKDVDYIKFESGSKVYRDTVFEWFSQMAEGKYDMNDFTTEEIEPTELYSAYLKHQLSTEGIKEENILGSQFRKIVFGVKYSPLVRNNTALLAKFTGLEKEFFDTVSNILEVEQNDLFSLLGIEKQKDGTYKVSDMRKFLKLIANESIKRGVAINNIDYIRYNEATKNAQYPLDYAFNRQQIQDLLAGLIDERLRRLKVNGSSLIQVSSAGFENKGEFRNSTWEERKKYGTTGLHYYHLNYDSRGVPRNTSTMGVKVALTKAYTNLLNLPAPASLGVSDTNEKNIHTGWDALGLPLRGGVPKYDAGKIGTLKRLNEAMKDEAWKADHMDKFLLMGYRIPTQNNNFIDRMEIMEFLPPSAGAVIIAPIELIIKSGSDFDIDKMNILRPAFSRDGDIIKEPAESLADIVRNINSSIYEERDIKAAKRDLNKLLNSATSRADDLEDLQRKVRRTMLDLMIKTTVNDSIIDKIIANIKNHEKVVIPENATPEDEAFTDEEITDLETFDLNRTILDFVKIDREIETLRAASDVWKKERKDVDKNLVWFEKKRQYKNAQNNKMIDVLDRTLSHPVYFEMLVAPSTTRMFEAITNDLIAAKDNLSPEDYQRLLAESEGKLFDKVNTPEVNARYEASLEAFDNLLSKMKDLGGYAIQRTFTDMFNFVKLSLAKTYSYNLRNGKTETKTIYTPLVPPEDRDKVQKEGRILMYGESVSGIPIKDSFDELISLTVDLANSPAYAKMGINVYNKKHIQYLLHQKVDPKVAIWFVNQPVLQDLYALYEKERRTKQGYTLKHAITDMALRLKILDNPQKEKSSLRKYELAESTWVPFDAIKAEEEGRKGERRINSKKANKYLARPYLDLHQQNLLETDYFSFEEMDTAIKNKEKNTPLQKKVLAYFASMIDEADYLMKLQFANNVDTTKYSTLTSLIRNINNRRSLRTETTLFNRGQLNALEKESMIAPFDYTLKAHQIHKALFPKLYTDRTIYTFTELITDIWGAKNVQIERISKIIENDYIEFIYKNFGEYNGQNLSEYFTPLLVNLDKTPDHEYFADRFQDIKNKYPELLSVPFVSGLYSDNYYPSLESSNDFDDKTVAWDMLRGWADYEIHNLFFLRNPDNPTHEKNVFTGNWRNLINFSPEKLGLKENYTEAQAREISEFFHEMVYFSLFQSGQTNTGNGFSDLIPYEHWGHFIQQTFNNLDAAKARNSSLESQLLKVFEIAFKQMNPKINWQNKNITTGDYDENRREITKTLPFYKNYYRGKDYLATDDDLSIARTLVTDEIDDITIPISEQPPTKPAPSVYKLGRYVSYNDEIYIIVKETVRPGVWQIYNPIKEGTMAKLNVHERNLEARSEMGNVVQYGQKMYLVTKKGEIIDLDKNKKVIWSRDNMHRKNVMELVKKQPPQEDGLGPDGKPPIRPECQ